MSVPGIDRSIEGETEARVQSCHQEIKQSERLCCFHTSSTPSFAVQLLSCYPTLCDPMDCTTSSVSFTISQSSLKLTSIQSVMPSNHLLLCRPLLLPPSVFPSIRVLKAVTVSDVVTLTIEMCSVTGASLSRPEYFTVSSVVYALLMGHEMLSLQGWGVVASVPVADGQAPVGGRGAHYPLRTTVCTPIAHVTKGEGLPCPHRHPGVCRARRLHTAALPALSGRAAMGARTSSPVSPPLPQACGCPLYWKGPLFCSAGGERTGSVSVHKFVAMWRK